MKEKANGAEKKEGNVHQKRIVIENFSDAGTQTKYYFRELKIQEIV